MSDIPTATDFLKAQADAELEAAEVEHSSGYALRPLTAKHPSIKQLHAKNQIIETGHKPPMGWAVRVRLGRDPRRYIFTVPTKRDATYLAEQFGKTLRGYLIDESGDRLWNVFVLRAARHVDARLKKIGGIDPPSDPVFGPETAEGHRHEWHWTGTWSAAKPFPVWHMRCACGFWALLANKATDTGQWVGYDDVVHDIRGVDGTPIAS